MISPTLTTTEQHNLTFFLVSFFKNKIPDNIYPRIFDTCAELGAKN